MLKRVRRSFRSKTLLVMKFTIKYIISYILVTFQISNFGPSTCSSMRMNIIVVIT